MPVDHVIDDRLAAADPAPGDSTAGWVTSPEGLAVFERVSAAVTLAETAGREPRRRRPRRWGRRLALAGTFVAALAALGLSSWVALGGRDSHEAVLVGPGFSSEVGPGQPDDTFLGVRSPGPGVAPGSSDSGAVGPQEFVEEDALPGPDGAPRVRRIRSGDTGETAGAPDAVDGGAEVFSGPRSDAEPDARVVKTASMRVEVAEGELGAVHRSALGAVERSGGFVQHSERTARSVRLTVRAPAERFEALLADLGELGEVTGESVSGEDVSEELVDLDARLRHWRAQEAVLLGIMGRAGTVAESVEVRRELAPVQETIERLEGRRRVLDDRVELSAIDLDLVDPTVEPHPGPGHEESGENWLSGAWNRARGVATGVVGGTLVALAALVPVALLWLVPGYVAWSLVRRRNAGREVAADPSE